MYRKFVEFIKQNELFIQHDNLVVGVSGGADSVCLLHLLCKLRKEMPLNLCVVHINHLIRKEAGEDALFVEKLCREYDIPFYLKEADVITLSKEWNMSTEEAGRKVRYDAFRQALNGREGKIVVAHNQNDVAETVLFHLFRGSSGVGLTGIRPKNGDIVRPILCFGREEIEKYLEENNLSYCIDKTNLTDDYTRNKIRNHILPYVDKEIVTGSVSHIYKTAALLAEQEEYICMQVTKELSNEACFEKKDNVYVVDRAYLEGLPVFMQKRLIYELIQGLSGSKKDITAKHIESVLSLLQKQGMKFVSLPYNLQAKTQNDKLIIESKLKTPQKAENSVSLDNAKGFTFQVISGKMPDTIPEKTYTKWFDYDKIDGVLAVRTRREGDFFYTHGGAHKKSLSRYFIDEKVPMDKRDEILLVADGSHILWIVGMRISDYYKITDKTKTRIEIHYDGGL